MKLLLSVTILIGCLFFISSFASAKSLKTSVVETSENNKDFSKKIMNASLILKNNVDNGYYENPFDVTSCSDGEVNVTISGIGGAICSPPCPDMSCPSDPAISARAQCALQASSGEKYCALICSPEVADSQCGENASCKALIGIGICTYDSA